MVDILFGGGKSMVHILFEYGRHIVRGTYCSG